MVNVKRKFMMKCVFMNHLFHVTIVKMEQLLQEVVVKMLNNVNII